MEQGRCCPRPSPVTWAVGKAMPLGRAGLPLDSEGKGNRGERTCVRNFLIKDHEFPRTQGKGFRSQGNKGESFRIEGMQGLVEL